MDELRPDLRAALEPRVQRLGYLGEFFKCTGHQPDALRSFMALTDDLKRALPDDLTELVALTVATAMANDYERNQHERLAEKLGRGREWIAAVEALDADSPLLSEQQRVLQRLAVRLISQRGQQTGPDLDAVVAAIGPEQAVAVLMLVGRYVAHALVVNSLELAPPVSSIFSEPSL
jgi:alkylhydroperoxidase family enzyme